MHDKASFMKIENELAPGFRQRVNSAEGIADLQQAFATFLQDILGRVSGAEGELQASKQLFQAARPLAQEPQAILLRYLETLTVIGADKNTTVVFPLPMDLVTPFLAKAAVAGSGGTRGA